MTASILTVRDNLDRVSNVVDRIAEFADHNIEFAYLRLLVDKLRKNVDGATSALMRPVEYGCGSVFEGVIGVNATGDSALRRAAYVSALNRAMSSGRFDELRHEQELIDPNRVLWRQYAPAEPMRRAA